MSRSSRVIVVGAGLGGLSAALRLAAAGYEVDVFERQSFPGGKAGSEAIDGFRFDTGPSLLTMPYVLAELFAEVDLDWSEQISVERLSPICNYFWSDGTRLSAYGEPERFAAEIEAKTGEPAQSVHRYLEYARRIHDTAAELFLNRSLHEASTYLSGLFWRSLLKIGRIDALRTMNQAHERYFCDPRVIQLFNRYATYNGSSPFSVPATLNIIPYVEYGHGGFAVNGGIHAIPAAIEAAARNAGARFYYEHDVQRIVYDDSRRVRGVEVGGGRVAADAVVCNVDVSVAYPRLLGDERAHQLERYRRLEPSSSGLVFYWGIDREFSELSTNNIFFSDDYRTEFRSIFQDRRCPAEPTVYVNITSKTTPGDAPSGCENWFVLINAPYVDGQQWEAETARVRQRVLERVSGALGVNVAEHIIAEGRLTPPEIEARTGSYRGALYGISSNGRMAAFARHPNRSRDYEGLYFCGGSAHPGGGMPLVILSGKITAEIIKQRLR